MSRILVLAFLVAVSAAQAAEAPKPKFGPEAVPILSDNSYLRQAPAPDYWILSAFYVPQRTSSDCSAAAVTMAVNALRGLPPNADQAIITESALLESVSDATWNDQVADEGPGVTFGDLQHVLREGLDSADLKGATIEAVKPAAADDAALTALRSALATNEASPDNVMLVYFNQGVITGDWDGPHISAIGAYDAAHDRALVMDVDRDWYVPYWTSTATLLAALVKPAPADQGVLAGETGGYVIATKK
jgi:Phytochelatin synthase